MLKFVNYNARKSGFAQTKITYLDNVDQIS